MALTLSSYEQPTPVREMYRLGVWNAGWTIEDEQCQKIGGGYKAVRLRFLLFL